MSVTVVVMVLLSLPTDLKQRREVSGIGDPIGRCKFPEDMACFSQKSAIRGISIFHHP